MGDRTIMKKMFARFDWLMEKYGNFTTTYGGGKSLKSQNLRLESLEDRLLLAVTAADYQNILDNYAEFGLPADRSEINIIEIEAEDISIANLKAAISQAAETEEDDLIVIRTSLNQNIVQFTSASDTITIDFAPTDSKGEIQDLGSLTIIAYGNESLTIDAAGLTRVLTIQSGRVNLGNVTVRGGNIIGEEKGETYYGAGIANETGFLQIKSSVITSNSIIGGTLQLTNAQGAGLWNGEDATAYLYDTTISLNRATAYNDVCGGGLYNAGKMQIEGGYFSQNNSLDYGGGLYNAETGVLDIIRTTFVENKAAGSNGGRAMSAYGGALYNAGTASIYESSFSKNSAEGDRALGGAVYNAGNLSAVSSEFFNNRAEANYPYSTTNISCGGGALFNNSVMNLYHCSIAGNTAKNTSQTITLEKEQFAGSGITNNKMLNVYNSIIAFNAKEHNIDSSSAATTRCYYSMAPNTEWSSADHEIEYDKTLPLFAVNPIFSANGTLQNPDELDLFLAADSQVIDQGNVGYATRETDLAGGPRIRGNGVDLGAYEFDEKFIRKLETPLNFTISAVTPTDLLITWNSVRNADYYILRYATDQNNWTEIEVSGTSYELEIQNPEKTIYFTIQACSELTKYADSDISEPIPFLPSKLATPQNIEATAQGPSSVLVVWDPVENADTYILRYWTVNELSYVDVTVEGTSYLLEKLNGSFTYHFKVCAVDSKEQFTDSDFSATVSVMPGKLPAPENVTAKIVDGESSITLEWDPVEHASGYQISWRSSTSLLRQYVETSKTTYTFTGLDQSAKYYFTVKAFGSGSYSDSDFSTPEVSAGWTGLTVVTTLEDENDFTNGSISLREAIYYAGRSIGGRTNPTTITFDPDLAGGVCVLTKGTLEISKSITIDASQLSENFIIDGGGKFTVFTIVNGKDDEDAEVNTDVALINLTIQNGLAATESQGGILTRGGGICSTAHSVSLQSCTVTRNTAKANILGSEYGDAVAYGGGIYASGKLLIANSTISENKALATTYTLSPAYRSEAFGGGIYAADLEITHSFVTQNTAQAISNETYAIAKGGGILASGTIVNTLVNRNVAQADSGKQFSTSNIYAMSFGGGICQLSNLTITNSTIAKNSAWSTRSKDKSFYSFGGGVCALSENGPVKINNSIVLLNNTSYISGKRTTEIPTGSYEGYDICLYSVNRNTLEGHNNISTYSAWCTDTEKSSGNVEVIYTYSTKESNGSVTINYGETSTTFSGEKAFQHFLDNFFVDVYEPEDEAESIMHEDYRLAGNADWAVDLGSNELAVEADGTPITTDLEGGVRIKGDIVDIGAYELKIKDKKDKMTVTTNLDVVDENDGETSLREALAYAAEVGETGVVTFLARLMNTAITLDPSLGSVVISESVTIDASNILASDGTPTLVIDGSQLQTSIFSIADTAETVSINGLAVSYGTSETGGAGIYSEAQNLNLTNMLFAYNKTLGSGGAVWTSGDISATNTIFINNTASGTGGAVNAGGSVQISNTTFRSNIATETGGAFYAAGNANVSNSTFTSNSALRGGAVAADARLTITGSRLTKNSAYYGGAVWTAGETVITGSVLSGNKATGLGGAVYTDAEKIYFINTQIDNSTAQRGGAVYLKSGIAEFRNATVTHNTADDGSAIYAVTGSTANLYNTIAAENNGDAGEIVTEMGSKLNAYKALSSYTDWTNKSAGLWEEYDSHYPLFAASLADGIYRLSLTAAQAIDLGDNSYAVNENGELLEFDISGNNRIVATRAGGEPIVDLGASECQATDGRNIQQVYGETDIINAMSGDPLSLTIYHELVKLFNDSNATTLSLRIHFNSNYLTFDSSKPGVYEKADLTGQGNFTVYSDLEDYDGDAATDCYILVTWNNQDKLWKGAEIVKIFDGLDFMLRSNLDPAQDHVTTIRFTDANITANFQFLYTPIEIRIDKASFDIDGDGIVNISTDVNLLLRYMAGKRGSSLTDNLVYANSGRTTEEIEQFMEHYGYIFDIDGDGKFNAAVDGEILTRYLAGFTGASLLSGISIQEGAIRSTAEAVILYMDGYLTGKSEAQPTTDNAHIVQPSIAATVVSGEVANLNLSHILTPQDEQLTGTTLTLRVYYDSTYFTVDPSAVSYYTNGIVGPKSNPIITGLDVGNLDGNKNTDSWLQLTWNVESGWTWSSKQIGSLLNIALQVKDVAGDLSEEEMVSTISITSLDRTAGFKMDDVDVNVAVVPSHFGGDPETDLFWLFDIDGSGTVDIATDGNLLLRYLIFGNVMSADGLLADGVSTRDEEQILDYLNKFQKGFDIDGDGVVKLDTDVTYFLKYFAGYRGDELLISTPSNKAVRKTGEELASYIKRFIPENQRFDPMPKAASLPQLLEAEEPAIFLAADLPVIEVIDETFNNETVIAVVSEAAPRAETAVPQKKSLFPAASLAEQIWEKPFEEDLFVPQVKQKIETAFDFFRPAEEEEKFDGDWFRIF